LRDLQQLCISDRMTVFRVNVRISLAQNRFELSDVLRLAKFSPTIGMVGPWASISRDPDRQRPAISEHTLSRDPSDRWFLLLLSRRRCEWSVPITGAARRPGLSPFPIFEPPCYTSSLNFRAHGVACIRVARQARCRVPGVARLQVARRARTLLVD
jgi:hypothetical protein